MSGAAARTGFLRKKTLINYISKEGLEGFVTNKTNVNKRPWIIKKKRNGGYIKINRTGGDHGILLIPIAIEE